MKGIALIDSSGQSPFLVGMPFRMLERRATSKILTARMNSLFEFDLIPQPQIFQQDFYLGRREVGIKKESPMGRPRRPSGITAYTMLHQLCLDRRTPPPGSSPENGVCTVEFSLLSLHSVFVMGSTCDLSSYIMT